MAERYVVATVGKCPRKGTPLFKVRDLELRKDGYASYVRIEDAQRVCAMENENEKKRQEAVARHNEFQRRKQAEYEAKQARAKR